MSEAIFSPRPTAQLTADWLSINRLPTLVPLKLILLAAQKQNKLLALTRSGLLPAYIARIRPPTDVWIG